MPANVLSELRLLSSTHYDSRTLLSVILAGDARLQTKLRRDELLPLGSRMRIRLAMDYADRTELRVIANSSMPHYARLSIFFPSGRNSPLGEICR